MKKNCYNCLGVLFIIGILFGILFVNDAYAGGWISGDAGVSSYDGGSGGLDHNCSNVGGAYLFDCTGYSWVFYKSTGDVESSIYFRPDLSSNSISKVCSEHTDQNGGFWHFGRNAQGLGPTYGYNKQLKWQGFAYFGDLKYLYNYYDTDARVTYSTGVGSWGHMETLNYRLYGTYGSGYYNTELPLNHTIYVDGTPIYTAEKYGTINQVLQDYKKAYRYVNGSDYTGSSLPGGMYAFCYWDDMDQKLTVEGKNIYNNGDLNDGDQSVGGTGNVSVSYKDLWNNRTDKYKFIGWKENASSGRDNIILDTDSKKSLYVSSPVGVKFDDWTKEIYRNLNVKNLTNNKTVYAYYAPACKLAIDAGTGTTITVNRGKSPYSGASNNMSNGDNLYKGDELSITFGLNSGYTWQSHTVGGANFNSGNIHTVGGSGATCNGATVATRAVRDEFQGQSRVSEVSATWEDIPDSKKATTGWTNVNGTTAVHNIQNCDPVNGCTVRFAHWLRRTAGGGPTTYSVTRTSNYYSISSGTIISTTTEDFSEPTTASGNKRVRLEDFTNKLYPGQAVCETLTFRANISVGNVSIKACALALGDAQPKNPDGSSTLLDIEVSKDGGVTYQKEVYAKPGDSLKFKATYNPVLQYAYKIIPEKMRIDSGTIYPSSGRNTTRYLGMDMPSLTSMFNLYKGSGLKNWNNDFSVYSANFLSELGASNEFFRNYDVDNGVTVKQEPTNDHSVSTREVGRTLRETAVTNLNDDTKTTPSQVSFSNNGGYNLGNVITAQIEKIALARVPYNFNNSTEITRLKSGGNLVYAGENETIEYNAIVGTRRNNTTGGTYATIVRKARLQLLACEGSCDKPGTTKHYTNVVNNVTLNSSGNLDGYTDPKEMTVNIPDLPAGSKMCFKSRVYPASVINDTTVETEWESIEYPWIESEERCYDVAKRPSLQVWGGSVYSAGAIALDQSVKNNLAGYGSETRYGYDASTAGDKRVFGTWTELGLMAGGAVTGVSSGAGWGYAQTSDALAAKSGGVGGLGGSDDIDFCKVSTLSFANAGCNTGNKSVGNLGASSSQNDSSNKSGLISRFAGEDDEYERINGASGNISEVLGRSGDAVLVFEATNVKDDDGNDVLDEAGNVKKLATRVIDAGGNNITIDKNIIYGGRYTNLASVPKVIIYAENINIDCGVTRIDAVLIANKNVDTCADGGKGNSEKRSKQLMVNGSIITNTLTLGRTYGAATGVNSIVPAEIVNYDSSLYLWANRQASATKSGDLTESYITELAPRY